MTNAALYSCLHVLRHKFDADPALAGETQLCVYVYMYHFNLSE